eukprot:TRINITY_DN26052_c0_g1_i1.p1 TRINITY_DN26052_c0_g1~~TRINITY_DN26052_c0_g1_i1.p1  ORF type:complete len:283 (+),score=57.49 TRINITY_DN26052_c0_g1_i1:50-898(+)
MEPARDGMKALGCSPCLEVGLPELPGELLQGRVLLLLDGPSLASAAGTCRQLRREGAREELWEAVYDLCWPAWTLLKAPEDEELRSARLRFARRWSHTLTLQVAPGVRALTGTVWDDFDGNATPVMADVGMQSGHFGAHVSSGQGSLHNTPTTGVWIGTYGTKTAMENVSRYGAAESNNLGVPETFYIEWEEAQHSSRSLWVYRGVIGDEGRRLSGTFHLKIMPRKKGTFEFTACPQTPSPEGDSKPPLTIVQLSSKIVRQQLQRGQRLSQRLAGRSERGPT